MSLFRIVISCSVAAVVAAAAAVVVGGTVWLLSLLLQDSRLSTLELPLTVYFCFLTPPILFVVLPSP